MWTLSLNYLSNPFPSQDILASVIAFVSTVEIVRIIAFNLNKASSVKKFLYGCLPMWHNPR